MTHTFGTMLEEPAIARTGAGRAIGLGAPNFFPPVARRGVRGPLDGTGSPIVLASAGRAADAPALTSWRSQVRVLYRPLRKPQSNKQLQNQSLRSPLPTVFAISCFA